MEKNVQNLNDFVKENHFLLTALGIFVALTLFAKDFAGEILGTTLSIIFFSCVFLLWSELWHRFPKKGERRLGLFETLISYAVLVLFIVLLLVVGQFSLALLFILLVLLLGSAVGGMLSGLLKWAFNNTPKKETFFRHFLAWLLIVFSLAFSWLMVNWLFTFHSSSIEYVIDYISNTKLKDFKSSSKIWN